MKDPLKCHSVRYLNSILPTSNLAQFWFINTKLKSLLAGKSF